jgi:hypothetical protein
MPYTTLNLGLSLNLPTNGTRNWGTTMRSTTWTKISGHDHSGGGNGTQIPTGGLADRSVTSAKLALNWGEVVATTLTPAGTTQTVDWANGKVQTLDLGSASGDVTATLSNPSSGAEYKLLIIQGATPRAITWPGTVKWANGQAPILSELANDEVALVKLLWNGTSYYGGWDIQYA